MLNVESPRAPGTESPRRPKPLTLLPLVALIFYDVSGGPFGTEDAVSAGGPLLAILGFLILPLLWSVQEALVTAELATTFPENSGFVAWVTAAFGPFWGWMEGFMKWTSGVVDNALYPVVFMTYLEQLVPAVGGGSGVWRLAVLLSINASLTYLNYRGLHVVGSAAVWATVFTLAPFGLMCVLGAPQVRPANWLAQDWSAVQWVPFLNVMFWNLNYFDSVSTLAGEVENPAATFPRGLAAAVALVVASYLLPLLVGVGVAPDVSDWKLGYFADVAKSVGGNWLGWWVVASAAVSQLGQFEAEMSTDSYQLLGMAERGFLPAIFASRSRHGTPTAAIIASAAGVAAMAAFNFMQIVELLNVVYCMAELLEFAAFLWLRVKYPTLARPFRVPLSTAGCVALLGPAFVLLALMLALPVIQGELHVVLFTVCAVAVGAGLYPLLGWARAGGWCAFAGQSPQEFKEHLYTTYSARERAGRGEGTPLTGSFGSSVHSSYNSNTDADEGTELL